MWSEFHRRVLANAPPAAGYAALLVVSGWTTLALIDKVAEVTAGRFQSIAEGAHSHGAVRAGERRDFSMFSRRQRSPQSIASRSSPDPVRSAARAFELHAALPEATSVRIVAKATPAVLTGAAWYSGDGTTFRTVCVRLCDGAMTQISFSTIASHFARDEQACRSSCSAPARLYVLPNPNAAGGQMVNLDGEPYSSLPAADRFRTTYDMSCSCRPEAWQEASRQRHAGYASAAELRHNMVVAAIRDSLVPPTTAIAAPLPITLGSAADTVALVDRPGDGVAEIPPEASVALRNPAAPARRKPVRGAGVLQLKDYDWIAAFGAPLAPPMGLGMSPSASPARRTARAETAQRVYNGTDWRISVYQPY